jgi:hypothetical protein
METKTWENQLDKVLTSCRWKPVVSDVRLAIAKQYLQRAFYSTVTVLQIDLSRSLEGGYLIRAYDPVTNAVGYVELEYEDLQPYIREIAFITGMENYAISRDIIEFVLERTFKRKKVLI